MLVQLIETVSKLEFISVALLTFLSLQEWSSCPLHHHPHQVLPSLYLQHHWTERDCYLSRLPPPSLQLRGEEWGEQGEARQGREIWKRIKRENKSEYTLEFILPAWEWKSHYANSFDMDSVNILVMKVPLCLQNNVRQFKE